MIKKIFTSGGTINGLRKPRQLPRKSLKRPIGATKTKKITKSLLKKADEAYSLKIRQRDGHCQFPGCESTKMLQNSHYISRANKITRFDDDNCIALCWFHHYKSKDLGFEYQKQRKEIHGFDGQYTLFMQKRLGINRFNDLINRSLQKKYKLTADYLTSLIQELKK